MRRYRKPKAKSQFTGAELALLRGEEPDADDPNVDIYEHIELDCASDPGELDRVENLINRAEHHEAVGARRIQELRAELADKRAYLADIRKRRASK